jgi:hypothetical protein
MDWLRSEDLNEEHNVTTPLHYYSSPMRSVVAKWCKGVPFDHGQTASRILQLRVSGPLGS